MFKLEISQVGNFPECTETSFEWLNHKPSHSNHMGLEGKEKINTDLALLESACAELEITLPVDFVTFMTSPNLWEKFRSTNAGFFDIGAKPVKCPVSDGYLIPFISDQQYCHFYFLHVVSGKKEYEIVWADDLYYGAIYATPEECESAYATEFNQSNIYLCNVNFANFMRCHYEEHETWFVENGF